MAWTNFHRQMLDLKVKPARCLPYQKETDPTLLRITKAAGLFLYLIVIGFNSTISQLPSSTKARAVFGRQGSIRSLQLFLLCTKMCRDMIIHLCRAANSVRWLRNHAFLRHQRHPHQCLSQGAFRNHHFRLSIQTPLRSHCCEPG